MRLLHVLGRAMFGGFFIYNGLSHFQRTKQMSQCAAGKRALARDAAVLASGAMLVTGGLSVATGFMPRKGLVTLIAFLLPVTLQTHRFWEQSDQEKRQHEMTQFLRNMALLGAALTMMGLEDSWPASLDRATQQLRGWSEYRLLPAA